MASDRGGWLSRWRSLDIFGSSARENSFSRSSETKIFCRGPGKILELCSNILSVSSLQVKPPERIKGGFFMASDRGGRLSRWRSLDIFGSSARENSFSRSSETKIFCRGTGKILGKSSNILSVLTPCKAYEQGFSLCFFNSLPPEKFLIINELLSMRLVAHCSRSVFAARVWHPLRGTLDFPGEKIFARRTTSLPLWPVP
jgi:hypothetical protein